MKLVKQDDADKFANSDKCFGLEYSLNEPAMNLAVIEIHGRYPSENYVVNEISKEICYVVSGDGKIAKKNGEILEFTAGDMVFIDSGEAYYWDAECKVATICAPAWAEKQHKEVK